MSAVIGRWCLALLAASCILVGCSSQPDRQWYKPGGNYTVQEFARDRDACTKDKVLDEQCLKQRGWFPLTGDRKPEPPKSDTGSRGPRY